MLATLLTEWQCNFLYYKGRAALKGASISGKATLKRYVQPVKTIPANLLLTVILIIQIQHFAGNYGDKAYIKDNPKSHF